MGNGAVSCPVCPPAASASRSNLMEPPISLNGMALKNGMAQSDGWEAA